MLYIYIYYKANLLGAIPTPLGVSNGTCNNDLHASVSTAAV